MTNDYERHDDQLDVCDDGDVVLSDHCRDLVEKYKRYRAQRMSAHDQEQKMLQEIIRQTHDAGLSLRKTAQLLGVNRAIVEYARKTMMVERGE